MYHPHFRKNRDNVPILKRTEIDDIAEQYAIDYIPHILDRPQAFNIDGFLEQYLDLTLDYQYLSSNGQYLGMTVFNDTNKVIVYLPEINEADYIHADYGTIIIDNQLLEQGQEHRYRFTLGHECGHWVFHRAYYGYDPYQMCLFELNTPYVSCREVNRNDLRERTSDWDDIRWMEWQADQFAAGILMPATTVRSLFQHSIGATATVEIDRAAKTVSDIYNVSEQAAYLRLCHLGIIDKPETNEQFEQLSFL